MYISPVSALNFKAGKIELKEIAQSDLLNFDSIQKLAKKNNCDILIEKKDNIKFIPDYIVYNILARRKSISQKYIYEKDAATVSKSATQEEVAKKIFEAIDRASSVLKKKSLEIAKNCLK